MDEFELGSMLTGKQRKEDATRSKPNAASVIYGVAESNSLDSEDSTVDVYISGETVSCKTQPNVRKGDEVEITIVGHRPTITGVTGEGDRTQQELDSKIIVVSIDTIYSIDGGETWSRFQPDVDEYLVKTVVTMSDGSIQETIAQSVTDSENGYITYDESTGTLTLGKVGDLSKLTIDNDSLDMILGDKIVAYISQDKFYSTNAEVSGAFYIGQYSIRTASNGNLAVGKRR